MEKAPKKYSSLKEVSLATLIITILEVCDDLVLHYVKLRRPGVNIASPDHLAAIGTFGPTAGIQPKVKYS